MKRLPTSPNRRTIKFPHEIELSGSVAQGWGAVVLGTPFVGIGIGLLLATVGVIALPGKGNSQWTLLVFAAIFAIPGMIFMRHGLVGVLREARANRMRRSMPDEYWLADYSWNPRGIGDKLPALLRKHLIFSAFLILFTTPFHFMTYELWQEGGYSWLFPGVFCAAADACVLLCLLRVLRLVTRWLKCGRPRISFQRFPFFLGGNLDVDLICSQQIVATGEVTVGLRYIQEAFETSRSGSGSNSSTSTSVVCYQTYEDIWTIDADQWNAIGGVGRAMSIPLPNESKYCNDLLARPARYWDLKITVPMNGVDYEASFLMPVYDQIS
jgi:hypothetical protein